MTTSSHTAFLILAPESGNNSTSSQSSNGHTLTLATLSSIDAARQLARELAAQGVSTIELSSSFGNDGLSAVQDAAGEMIRVGLVRF